VLSTTPSELTTMPPGPNPQVTDRAGGSGGDPFDTAGLRAAVLQAWVASPQRFREDANAEEALALGGYAGRVVAELVANGVDAARIAGVPARVSLSFDGAVLTVRNSGAPLTAAGVAALASLRASAKRESAATVGHFGVGFTAVRSIGDRVSVRSTDGGVVFDAALAEHALAGLAAPALHREVGLRDGRIPVLRLPFPADPAPAGDSWTTTVTVDVRPSAAPAVREQLASAAELMWALPHLDELTVIAGEERRWQRVADPDDASIVVLRTGSGDRAARVVQAGGTLPAALLADRPVEEQGRGRFELSWVLPLDEPAVGFPIGAPMPTDEQLTFPARLVGTFPVDDTRRRLAPGPLTDFLLDRAAALYLELVAASPAEQRAALVPGVGFPAGPVDADLQDAVLRRWRTAPLLVSVNGDTVAPVDAVVADGLVGRAAELLGEATPGLLEDRGAAATAALLRLGARRAAPAELVTALAALDRPPAFWGELYGTLAERSADDLADVPVPLAGGRRHRGARGTLLAATDLPDELLARVGAVAPGLPLVDPAAAHPALLRWGAEPADGNALLAAPALVAAAQSVREGLDDDLDPDLDEITAVAGVLLDLATAGGRGGALGRLVLTDADGEPWPAAELLLPGAQLTEILDPDADLGIVGATWTDRWDDAVLLAGGVRDGFAVVTVPAGAAAHDVPDLPDLDDWFDDALDGGVPDADVEAVADLDLVAPDRWPAALELLLADPRARSALLTPVDGHPSYTAWWIGRWAEFDGEPPRRWRRPGAVELAGLFPVFPLPSTPQVLTAIGVPTSAAEAAAAEPDEFLRRYADPARTVAPAGVAALTGAAAAVLAADPELPLPEQVRVITGGCCPADDAVVLDVPWLAPLVPADRLVPGGADPAAVAAALELPVASATLRVTADIDPSTAGLPDGMLEAACAAVGLDDPPTVRSGVVTVDGRAVPWWPAADGWWVDGSPAAVGAVSAWVAGRWELRHRAAAAAAGASAELAVDGLAP
jgi:hypothetical protein